MQFFKADIHFPRNPLGCVLLAVWQEWSVGGVTNSHRIPTKYPTTTFKKLPDTPKSRGRNKKLSKTQSWKPKFRSNPSEIFKHICLHLWLPRCILHTSEAQLNIPRSKVCRSVNLFYQSNCISFLIFSLNLNKKKCSRPQRLHLSISCLPNFTPCTSFKIGPGGKYIFAFYWNFCLLVVLYG